MTPVLRLAAHFTIQGQIIVPDAINPYLLAAHALVQARRTARLDIKHFVNKPRLSVTLRALEL